MAQGVRLQHGMLRIDVEDGTVRLSGTVDADALGSLREILARLEATGAPVAVDLAGVTAVDRVGIEFLEAARQGGVRLRRPRGFVREWLRAERRSRLLIALGFLVVALIAGVARGEEPPAKNDDDWHFRAGVYGFLPHIGGSLGFPAPRGGEIDVDADDLVNHLEGTFMGTLEVQKGRFGAFTDLIYLDVGGSRSRSRDFEIGGAGIPVGVSAEASLGVQAWVWTVAGSYRAISRPTLTLDAFAGTRLLDIDSDLDLALSATVGPLVAHRRIAREASLQSWDGITGIKGRFGFDARRGWFFPFYLDVGTGGADVTWQGIAGVGYAFRWCEVTAAWRYLAYEFRSNERVESLDLNGPAIGLAFAW